jgi:hypothetical protein
MWVLEFLATLRADTPAKAVAEVQRAALYAGPTMLALTALTLFLMAARAHGWPLASFLPLFLATSFATYEGFRAGEVDHHGIALGAAMAAVLSFTAGAFGTTTQGTKTGQGRGWFALSGVCGGCGLWISTSTVLPVLAATAVAFTICCAAFRKTFAHADFVPAFDGVRTWGRWGAGTSLFWYMVEYFPNHMGLRLEANHPFYALAWLGGTEWLRVFCRSLAGVTPWQTRFATRADAVRFCASGIAVAVPVLLLLLAKDSVFWVADKFLYALHQQHIREFQNIGSLLGSGGTAGAAVQTALNFLLWPFWCVAGAAVTLIFCKLPGIWRVRLIFLLGLALLIQIESAVQVRWLGLSTAIWGLVAFTLFVIHLGGIAIVRLPLAVRAIFGAVALVALGVFPILPIIGSLAGSDAKEAIPQRMMPTIMLRDLAHRLIQNADKTPVVLTDPTSATEMAYYGGIKTVGTLYWENMEGLRRTARIYSAPTEEECIRLLKEAAVDYLVLPSWDDFSNVRNWRELLVLSEETKAEQPPSYLSRVLGGETNPRWLRPFYYEIPATFGTPGQYIHFLQVRYDQTEEDALLYRGRFMRDSGRIREAVEMFRQFLRLSPKHPEAETALREVEQMLEHERNERTVPPVPK